VFNANADKPPGFRFVTINNFTQEAIIVVIDRHKRGALQRLVQQDLSPAFFADVSDLTVKHLASYSKYAHGGGLVALFLSLIRLHVSNDAPQSAVVRLADR
jgi:hypothetical protein